MSILFPLHGCIVSCLLLSLSLLASCSEQASQPSRIVVGSKNFTESVILGELLAQSLEASGCKVDRRLNLGGTFVCDAAIRAGSLDAYPEYSGTALTAILKKPPTSDRVEVDRSVIAAYQSRGLRWGPNLGFNDTFAMVVRKKSAEDLGLRRISDLAKVTEDFRPGFGYEFAEREDGWKGLLARYGLKFSRSPKTMDLGLTYKALAAGEVDLIAGNSTDGLIESLDLVILEDDGRYFPPYDAAVVSRSDIDERCTGASKAFSSLENSIDDATMRRLNFEVDGKKRDPADVVREFRAQRATPQA